MSLQWAVRLPRDQGRALGTIRLHAGLEVLEASGGLWVRGTDAEADLELELRKLPGGERFSVLPQGVLVPDGKRTPSGRMPAGSWTPLSEWLVPELPRGALPGEATECARLGLARSGREEEATVVVAALEDWAAWAESAPALRLRVLDYAASRDGRVVVRGRPLPPLPGRRCVEREGVAIPCGFDWVPPVEPAVVRARLGLGAGDLALFAEDGSWEAVPAAGFVAACRSSVRLTRRRT